MQSKNGFMPLLILALISSSPNTSFAAVIGGVSFPQGARSFADAVVDYAPAGTNDCLTSPFMAPANALGGPDYAGLDNCPNQSACAFVSLGEGGSITLQFIDNALTGSGNTNVDLWIFEIGSDVERTFVELSRDGFTWHSVGLVQGSRQGIDIDAFGFGLADWFQFVRLTDDISQPSSGCVAYGADIDAVGAISSTNIPSRLRIRVSEVEICWDTTTNVMYQLRFREAGGAGPWQPFGEPFRGNGRTVCAQDLVPAGQRQRYYQLVETNAP